MTQRIFAIASDSGDVRRLVQLTLSGSALTEANVLTGSGTNPEPAVAATFDAKFVAVIRASVPWVYEHGSGNSYTERESSDNSDANAGDCFPIIAISPNGDWVAAPKNHPEV